MERFDVAKVSALVSEKEMTQEELYRFYWEKLRDFLLETKQETVSSGVIARIDKQCPGFEDFVMTKHASTDVKELLSRRLAKRKLRRQRRNLWRKNHELIRDATEYVTFRETATHYDTHTGILFSALNVEPGEEKQYRAFKNIFMACVSNEPEHDGVFCIPKSVFDDFVLLRPEYVKRLQRKIVPGYAEYLCEDAELVRKLNALSGSEKGFEILLVLPDKTYVKLVD